MKILYDHQIFTLQTYGGISRYFYELMNNFNQDQEIDFNISLQYSNNHYLKNAVFANHAEFFIHNHFRGKYRLINFINKRKSIDLLKKKDFDIFHPTYYDPYFLNHIGDKPFVLTIYDMIHEIFPNFFSYQDKTSRYKRLLAAKAAKIITISENSKRDIIRFYGIDENKITIIYLGSPILKNNKEHPHMDIPSRYILFVGNRDYYKNFEFFLVSVSSILINEDLNIVCVGGGRFSLYEQKIFKDLKIDNRIFQYSVNDDILASLYEKALAFVFPSLYEGFGIPVLEAFAGGCPVVLSNSSCLPETGGDAAVYFDPHSEFSIKEAVKKVIGDEGLRNRLKLKGFARLKKFSWDKTAKETKEVYKIITS